MKVLLLLAAAAVAAVHGDGIPVYGRPPPPHNGPVHYDESPKPFAYQYGVSDSYTGNDGSDACPLRAVFLNQCAATASREPIMKLVHHIAMFKGKMAEAQIAVVIYSCW